MQLVKSLLTSMRMYKNQHAKNMSTSSLAQLASTTLYSHRFFPYYSFIILAGLDALGRGAVYSFDPVGSFEREQYRASGSAAALIQPFLDSQVGLKNRADTFEDPGAPIGSVSINNITLDEALKLTKDAFTAAAERDIHTGDSIDIIIMTREGTRIEKFALRKD